MSEATRPVGNELVSGIVGIDRRLTLMETRFVRLAGNPVVLGDTVLTASAASITFSDIPQNFSHLRIECGLRGNGTGGQSDLWLRFNGDAGTNYACQYGVTVAGTATGDELFGQTQIFMGYTPCLANVFDDKGIYIRDYASMQKNKSAYCAFAAKVNLLSGYLLIGSSAGWWPFNTAITSISLLLNSNTFASGSRATLYGEP